MKAFGKALFVAFCIQTAALALYAHHPVVQRPSRNRPVYIRAKELTSASFSDDTGDAK